MKQSFIPSCNQSNSRSARQGGRKRSKSTCAPTRPKHATLLQRLQLGITSLLFIGTLVTGLDISAQDYSDRAMVDKMERLERDMNMLQQEVFRNGGGASSNTNQGSSSLISKTQDAALGVRLTALEEQIRALNGRIEETEHQQQQLSQQYNQLVEQIGYLQHSGSSGATATTPPTGQPALNTTDSGNTSSQPFTNLGYPVDTKQETDPIKRQYDTAFNLLQQTRYTEAEIGLKDFLAQHEDHPLAGNAYYWLGETYYMQKDYEQAAIQFLRGYKKFPKGEKAPDSLLKLSMSLGSLNKTKEACTSLTKLADEFKNASNAIKQKAKEESKQLHCS